MIVGSIPSSAAVGVHPGDSPEDIHSRLSDALTEVDQGDGVIVLCDMFGGTSKLDLPEPND